MKTNGALPLKVSVQLQNLRKRVNITPANGLHDGAFTQREFTRLRVGLVFEALHCSGAGINPALAYPTMNICCIVLLTCQIFTSLAKSSKKSGLASNNSANSR